MLPNSAVMRSSSASLNWRWASAATFCTSLRVIKPNSLYPAPECALHHRFRPAWHGGAARTTGYCIIALAAPGLARRSAFLSSTRWATRSERQDPPVRVCRVEDPVRDDRGRVEPVEIRRLVVEVF